MELSKIFANEALTLEQFEERTKDMKIVDLKEGGYVDKNKYENLLNEKESLKSQIESRDEQLKELKKVNPEELKETIARLQKENEDVKADFERKNHELKVNSAVDLALLKEGAKNSRAVRALLDLNISEAKFNEDGSLQGLSDIIKGIKESDSYLFESNEPSTGFKGQPAEPSGSDGAGIEPKSYADFVKIVSNEK